MSNEIPKDWEKEYNASFTKKIPFSYIQYESTRLNPAIEGLLYTFSTVKLSKDLKFELYAQNGTYSELTAIIKELKDKRAAEEAAKPKEEEKKEDEKKEEEPAPQPINYGYYGYGSQPQPPKKASGDLTEKALNILSERRRNQRKEQIEEQKKKEEEERKKLEEERKKKEEEEKRKEEEEKKKKEDHEKKKEEIEKKDKGKKEEKKDEEEGNEDEEEKKETYEEATEDSEQMYKVETEETFQQDIKNCRFCFNLKLNFSEIWIFI